MSARTIQAAQAALAVRLLQDDEAPGAALHEVDWEVLTAVTAQGALIRVTSRLAALGVQPPARVRAVVEQERHRSRTGLDLIAHTTRVCAEHNIPCLFPKALQHYPDMGDDVDVLLLTRSRDADRLILAGLPATPMRRDLGSRLAGAAAYTIGAGTPPLDIYHGRLGTAGEETTFPAVLWAGRRRVMADGVTFDTAAPEHQLVLHGLQRVYGRSRINLADMAAVLASVRHASLDWSLVLSLAGELGVLPGLGCLLAYVEQVHREVFGQPVLPAALRSRIDLAGWGNVWFDGRGYRYRQLAVGPRVYGHKFAASLRAGRWGAAVRLALVPLVGAQRALRWVARAGERRIPAARISSALVPEGRRS